MRTACSIVSAPFSSVPDSRPSRPQAATTAAVSPGLVPSGEAPSARAMPPAQSEDHPTWWATYDLCAPASLVPASTAASCCFSLRARSQR